MHGHVSMMYDIRYSSLCHSEDGQLVIDRKNIYLICVCDSINHKYIIIRKLLFTILVITITILLT